MKLPKFLYEKVKTHSTSLGNNSAFPPEEDYPFDYKVLKKRFIQVVEKLKTHPILGKIDDSQLTTKLSELLTICKKKERPIRENLLKLCENYMASIFDIPVETIEFQCELVDEIKPKHMFRLLPEDSDSRKFDFDDLTDFDNVMKVVLKRRLINSLVQGASRELTQTRMYAKAFESFDNELCDLYEQIIIINDYLLFTQQEKISDKHPMQGACVEVELGRQGEKTIIHAQGLIFPYLLTETMRGLFELFASHGLPEDNDKALYIIKQADFLLAEPWDLRFGIPLWHLIDDDILDNPKVIPYYFMSLCEMKVDEFNENLREMFAKTKRGKSLQNELVLKAKHDFDYDDLSATIQTQNDNKGVIEDEYMSENDIDNTDIANDQPYDYRTVLLNCQYSDIDFAMNPYSLGGISTNRNMYVITPIIFDETIGDDVEIPHSLVNLRAEEIFLSDTDKTYQLHITIDESLRQLGIATKIYRAFINIYGSACSLFANRKETYYDRNHMQDTTNGAISRLWNTLSTYPEIETQTITRYGQDIGIIAHEI